MMICFGWHVDCWCDGYYEPEGTVLFTTKPKVGDIISLPTNKNNEKWKITSVNEHEMSLKVTLLDE